MANLKFTNEKGQKFEISGLTVERSTACWLLNEFITEMEVHRRLSQSAWVLVIRIMKDSKREIIA